MSLKSLEQPKPKQYQNHFDYMLEKLVDSSLQIEAIKEKKKIDNEVSILTEMLDIYDTKLREMLQKWMKENGDVIDSIFEGPLKLAFENLDYQLLIGYSSINEKIDKELGIPIVMQLFDINSEDELKLLISYYSLNDDEWEVISNIKQDIIRRDKKLQKKQEEFTTKQMLVRDKITKKFINTVITNNNIDKYFKKSIDYDATNLLVDIDSFIGEKKNDKQ